MAGASFLPAAIDPIAEGGQRAFFPKPFFFWCVFECVVGLPQHPVPLVHMQMRGVSKHEVGRSSATTSTARTP